MSKRNKKTPAKPVVMIGSHDAANVIVGAKEKYLAAGFSDYLSKPIKGNK